MRIIDWSSDVCSSDLAFLAEKVLGNVVASGVKVLVLAVIVGIGSGLSAQFQVHPAEPSIDHALVIMLASLTLLALGIFGPGIATGLVSGAPQLGAGAMAGRSEEHTSELQSLMRISYAVFCLKKKKHKNKEYKRNNT